MLGTSNYRNIQGVLVALSLSLLIGVISLLFAVPVLSAGAEASARGVGEVLADTTTSNATATPDPSLTFTDLSGDINTSTNAVIYTVFGNTPITAQDVYTLTLNTVGAGDIACDPIKSTYQINDVITLTATADLGWTFTGWSGDIITSTNPVTHTILGNTIITATFTQDEYTLTLNTVGSGTVTHAPIKPTYHYGDVVMLAATADPGWTFTGWSGGLTGSTNPVALTISGNTIVTATFTPVSTATATVTKTATPTPTGTLPTPTATGTITPNPTVTVSVSPSEGKVNQNFTFTIIVTNGGKAPTQTGVLSNSFPSYMDVNTVTTSKGSVTKTSHSFNVTLGSIMPNETVTIIAIVKVNSSLTKSETVTNQAILVYDNNLSKTGSTSYKVVATTTLPGTGEISLAEAARLEAARRQSAWLSLAVIMVALGAAGLLTAAALGAGWLRRLVTGFALLLLAVTIAACIANATPPTSDVPDTAENNMLATVTPTLLPRMPASAFSTPEAIVTLPSFPIPTPEVLSTPEPGMPEPDTSPVNRIVIPALGVDTVVAYVPYDEDRLSWLIEGLREEVAWLGNTSWPGLGSNTVLAGHVTVRGLGNGPFRYLENLAVGDQVTLYTEEHAYTYTMREQITVDETNLGVLLPTINPQLTLVTCTGWDTELEIYRYRMVVFANLAHTEPLVRQGTVR